METAKDCMLLDFVARHDFSGIEYRPTIRIEIDPMTRQIVRAEVAGELEPDEFPQYPALPPNLAYVAERFLYELRNHLDITFWRHEKPLTFVGVDKVVTWYWMWYRERRQKNLCSPVHSRIEEAQQKRLEGQKKRLEASLQQLDLQRPEK